MILIQSGLQVGQIDSQDFDQLTRILDLPFDHENRKNKKRNGILENVRICWGEFLLLDFFFFLFEDTTLEKIIKLLVFVSLHLS